MSQRPACPCGKLVRVAYARYRIYNGEPTEAYCDAQCASDALDDTLAAASSPTGSRWIALNADDQPVPFPIGRVARTRSERLALALGSQRCGLYLAGLVEQPQRYADPRWNLLARSIETRSKAASGVFADVLDRWLCEAGGDLGRTFSWDAVCARLSIIGTTPSWLADADVWGLLDAIAEQRPSALAPFVDAGSVASPERNAGVPVIKLDATRQALKRWLAFRLTRTGAGGYEFLASGIAASAVIA